MSPFTFKTLRAETGARLGLGTPILGVGDVIQTVLTSAMGLKIGADKGLGGVVE